VVKAGGQPWCVKTCPTDALRYDERDAILAEAKARLSQVQAHYLNARIYGETELDGLGVIMILPDAPEALGLPADPKVPVAMDVWQKAVQPASIGLTGLSLAFTGLAAIIARRNHQKEMGHTKSAVTEKEA
jgi:formate dehydrogenase iron-sulfur subunit